MNSPFQRVGQCIYCDTTKPPLSREHVMPRGLGGNKSPIGAHEAMVLLDASCEECREITRQFEDDCLAGMFGPARARLGMNRKDRSPPKRPAHVVYRDGRKEDALIGVDYLPGAMMIPSFSMAAIFIGLNWTPPPAVLVTETVLDDSKRLRDPAVHQVVVTLKFNLVSFARMLSKIGLGVAHYALGPDAFDPIARDFIRTGAGHPNHYVGGFDNTTVNYEPLKELHSVSLWHNNNLLVVTIQLLGHEYSPVNYAVVGWLRRMPPGLPHLPLGQPLPHQSKTTGPLGKSDPNTAIQWDHTVP